MKCPGGCVIKYSNFTDAGLLTLYFNLLTSFTTILLNNLNKLKIPKFP